MEPYSGQNFPKEHLPRQSDAQVCFPRELYFIARKPLRKLVDICNDHCDKYVRPSTYHLRSYAKTLCAIALPILNYERVWLPQKLHNVGGNCSHPQQRHFKYIGHLFMSELRRTDQLWNDISTFDQSELTDPRTIPKQMPSSHQRSRRSFEPGDAGNPKMIVNSVFESMNATTPAYSCDSTTSRTRTVFGKLSARLEESLATKPYLIIAYIYITTRFLFDYGEGVRQCLLDVLFPDLCEESGDMKLLKEGAFSFWSFNTEGSELSKFQLEQQFEQKLLQADSTLSKAERGEIMQEVESVLKSLQDAARSMNWKTLVYYANERVDTLRDKDQCTLSQWWHYGKTRSRREKQRLSDIERLMYHVRANPSLRYNEDESRVSGRSPKGNIRGTRRANSCSNEGIEEIMFCPSVYELESPAENMTYATSERDVKLAEAGHGPASHSDCGLSQAGSLYWRRHPPVVRKDAFWEKTYRWTGLVTVLILGYYHRKALSRVARRVLYAFLALRVWAVIYKKRNHAGG
ncbi:hypothetical protein KEM56_000167 [Ascosphaera pollenicola]|nr:hypothetical protein KEM56_000167 [Ascosphaera pollenicola]